MALNLMNVEDITKYLGLSRRTIYSMIKKGKIPYIKVGGQYRFIEDEIEYWLKSKSKREKVNFEKIKNTQDILTKRLLFMGLLTKEMEKEDFKPIVVGGNAVEFYTAGGYTTGDIDIIAPTEPVDKILGNWQFKKEGRHWYSEDLEIVIEAPAAFLEDEEQHEKLLEVEIDNLTVYIIGIEDLIVDRLNAYIHWNSTDDKFWAKELTEIHREEIDWDYLKNRAISEKIEKGLTEIMKELKIDEKD